MIRRGGVGIGAMLIAFLVGAPPAFGQPARSGSVRVRRVDYAGVQVNVVTMRAGVHIALVPRQAHGSVTSLQPVTSDCRPCLAAVNGDFFDQASHQPIGGVIINGLVLRSPSPRQNQLTIAPDGRISAGILAWRGELSAPDGTAMAVAVNDPTAASPIVYDRHFGSPTPLSGAVELAFSQRSSAGLRLGRTLDFRFVGAHRPGQPVPSGQIVVSATGSDGARLAALRRNFRKGRLRPTIKMTLTTDPVARNSLGANHVLLRGGRIMPIGEHDEFVFGGHPRTLFGWNSRRQITLVTIGSSTPGHGGGVSLSTAARILSGLGVTNAVNLDGGGSSTFVVHGQILNNPSDGVPRAVANAWVVTARRGARRVTRVPRPAKPLRHAHAGGHAHARVHVRTRRAVPTPTAPVPLPATATPLPPAPPLTRVTPSSNATRVALPARPRRFSSVVAAGAPKLGRRSPRSLDWAVAAFCGAMLLIAVERSRFRGRRTAAGRRAGSNGGSSP